MAISTFDDMESKMIIVVVDNCLKLNVREEPKKNSRIITVLNKGDVLEKADLSDSGSFSQVRLITGQYGYAMTKYLREV